MQPSNQQDLRQALRDVPEPDSHHRRDREVIAPLSENDIAQKSYHLFHVVMQAPVSLAYTQEKWEGSHLAMHGAYKRDKFLPWVEDSQGILTLDHDSFDLADRCSQDQHEPIQNTFRALAYASDSVTIEALGHLTRSNPLSFAVSATCTRTTSCSSFERPLSSSSPPSMTNGSTLLI